MLGTLRLFLALAVAASHAGFSIKGLNPGVVAVVGFYLISGYVMTGLLQRHYGTLAKARGFYLDRAVRLFPQYFLYAALGLTLYFLVRPENYHLSRSPMLADLANNLLVIPLNYYMWNDSDRFALIPPAWSLGAEIQFYLLAPLLLGRPARILMAGALGLGVYALALTGKINGDWFGYRLHPGILLYFMLGALLFHLHRRTSAFPSRLVAAAVLSAASATGLLLSGAGFLTHAYNRETLLGLAIGTLFLHNLAPRSRSRWDDLAGDISYGVFLNHFLVLWTFFPGGVGSVMLLPFFAICSALAWLTQRYFERPCLAWRRRLRTNATTASAKLLL